VEWSQTLGQFFQQQAVRNQERNSLAPWRKIKRERKRKKLSRATSQLEGMFPSNIADVGLGSTIDGTLTVVPEPSTATLCLLAGFCLAARRCRGPAA
jgi:hypothetical protein